LFREALASCGQKLREAAAQVLVQNLQLTDSQMLERMKEGEMEKRKRYLAVCWAARPLTQADKALFDGIRELNIQQATPVRVLHRRAPLVRTRVRGYCNTSILMT
jgi:tRNA pseudouridine synthase 10